MFKYIVIILLSITTEINAQESIYLVCTATNASDGDLLSGTEGTKNDFLIDKKDKIISQIITGLTDEQLKNLSHSYKETDTQYISDDGFISINKYTYEYSISAFGGFITGFCKTVNSLAN